MVLYMIAVIKKHTKHEKKERLFTMKKHLTEAIKEIKEFIKEKKDRKGSIMK